MDKQEFNIFIGKLLKNKAMLSSDIRDAVLKRFPSEKPNTIKSMILRSKSLRRSTSETYDNGCYAYTLKSNRNYNELFFELSNKDTDAIKFVYSILNENNSFISLFTFKKLLQINPNNEKLLNKKIEALRFYKETIEVNDDVIYPIHDIRGFDQSSDFFNNQKERLLAAKILLYKHNAENLIQISKGNYLGVMNNRFYYPKPLFNIYFDAYAHSPSYSNDLRQKSYVVYDFAISGSYTIIECKSFISRVLKLKAYSVGVIPICIYEDASEEVKALIKSSGLIGIKHSSYLGSEYNNILSKLNSINSNDDLNFSTKELTQLINSLKQIDLLDQTKGYLFEYVCFRFLYDYYKVKPERNVIIAKQGNNEGAQFDIVIKLSEETIVCECKATTASIGFGSLEKANIYTIAHTINKMTLLNGENKKLLYFVTSNYKKISEENQKILTKLVPSKAFEDHNCLYTFDNLVSIFSENEWLKTWNLAFPKTLIDN